MEPFVHWIISGKLIKFAVAAWMLFICGLILLAYRSYFPPEFDHGFLENRQAYFYGLYAVGFYAHIATAPLVLILGIVQCSRTVRRRYVRIHEQLGKVYCWLILWAMAPGGLILAFRAYSGLPATVAFVLLSVLTWWFTYRGRVSIRQWNMVEHGHWMRRSFILVCSAVLLRAMSAEAGHWQVDPDVAYAAIAWLCWVPTWLIYELWVWWSRHRSNPKAHLANREAQV